MQAQAHTRASEPEARPSRRARSRHTRHLLGLLLVAILTLACLLDQPNQVECGKKKLKKAAKSLAKGLILSKLTSRKNFLPVPLPIPVPIEINEPPVYIKGKPKYVNVYKPTQKPTPQPIIKPTTVYHMPVYSPTYEYMSMDPMSAVYANSAAMSGMYGPASMADLYAASKMKSTVNTGADSTSSSAAMNFNDYDDESGNYYMRKSAARQRRYAAAAPAGSSQPAASDYEAALSRIDNEERTRQEEYALEQVNRHEMLQQQQQQQQLQHTLSNHLIQAAIDAQRASADYTMLLPNHDDRHHDQLGNTGEHLRTKRQVYYQSGYNGHERCYGFPLEINIRSKIKMDQIFPIHGNSQFKKCIPVGKPLLPPMQDENY